MERELRVVSSCVNSSLSLERVNLETTCWSAAAIVFVLGNINSDKVTRTQHKDIPSDMYCGTTVFYREFGYVIT